MAYIDVMVNGRFHTRLRGQFRDAISELFDQRRPFGRLALVQVLMIAGDTLVTISLAGSLFFSISPEAAKGKVLLYLLITIAPFSVVSPLLGPLIDRGQGARRAMVIVAAVGRAALCPFMARDLHSLLLFPEAFFILILSKLYGVTKGALVPEMAARDEEQAIARGERRREDHEGYAEWNARLTLLGTIAGFLATIPAVIVLKTVGANGVLYLDAAVFLAGGLAGSRLPVVQRLDGPASRGRHARRPDRHLVALQPVAHPEVTIGLTANAVLRGLAGFLLFLVAFGLRRASAPLYWYGLVLGASGLGAMLGLIVMARLRRLVAEQQILAIALIIVVVAASVAASVGGLIAQVVLALVVGMAGSLGQPSFDAMAQRFVPEEVQGRAFARFATRQQLVWVLGALVPVVIPLSMVDGDVVIACVAFAATGAYLIGRLSLRGRALPRTVADRGGPGGPPR